MDPSGLLIATSSSDKMVCVFEFSNGECIAKLHGHSGKVSHDSHMTIYIGHMSAPCRGGYCSQVQWLLSLSVYSVR